MKNRYRLYRRKGSVYYALDSLTGHRESLRTKIKAQALALLQAKNEAHQQPALSLQKARIYLLESNSGLATRTWQVVMEEITGTKHGPTQERWERACKDKAFDLIRHLPLIETQAEHFLRTLKAGTVATNAFLRRLHNFALDMNWLPVPVIPKRQWPPVRYKLKRAITWEEHQRIVQREMNLEKRAFYQMCWYLGGAQGDIAALRTEDIDWPHRTISYSRKKTGTPALLHFGDEVAMLLRSLPDAGPLFPDLIGLRAADRATEFKRRCRRLGIKGVTLHSYRYAWAERAKQAGYPERFAQEALGHNSKAVHRAYAKMAKVKLPSLEEYERKVVPVKFKQKSAS